MDNNQAIARIFNDSRHVSTEAAHAWVFLNRNNLTAEAIENAFAEDEDGKDGFRKALEQRRNEIRSIGRDMCQHFNFEDDVDRAVLNENTDTQVCKYFAIQEQRIRMDLARLDSIDGVNGMIEYVGLLLESLEEYRKYLDSWECVGGHDRFNGSQDIRNMMDHMTMMFNVFAMDDRVLGMQIERYKSMTADKTGKTEEN